MKVSKFVTVVVEKKSEDEIGVECYMASDQCQTLERDNVLGNSTNPKKMIIRELEPMKKRRYLLCSEKALQ